MSDAKTQALSYSVWSSAWGPMGAVAGTDGIVRIVLPHYSPSDLDQVIRFENPGVQRDDKPFEKLVELSRAYFNRKKVDFAEVVCAMPAPTALTGKVLAACRQIPYGQTKSYSAIAKEIGSPDAARAVATALGKNPLPLVVPCHRVIYADGRPGGFSSPGGVDLKLRMLQQEKQ
jgi:methylated-DNA-[protein]-cysteine S-methyltransferase